MIMTNVYLAAGYDQQVRMRHYREILKNRTDITVTSRWIDVNEPVMQNTEITASPEQAEHYGHMDLEDIDKADVFVMFTDTPSTSGGRHTELGYALARDKVIFVVGPRENVFQAITPVIHFETWDQLTEYLFT